MSPAIIFQFVKKLLPMAKIGSYILSVLALGLAALLGANKEDMQKQFCASSIPDMPKIEAAPSPVAAQPK
jgi:hypothetical protein